MAQRIGYALIFAIAWFCWGWGIQGLGAALRSVEMPFSVATSNLAGQETQSFLQRSLAATPERDFLIALSLQQSGENEKAARVYQSVPQYAESWNNLGVIRHAEGQAEEARQAFQLALQREPTLPEAAFNLGQPASDYWTKLHQQYLPGEPMLAPPPHGLMMRAFTGGTTLKRLLMFWAAPLKPLQVNESLGELQGAARAQSVVPIILQFAFFLLILLFLLPRLAVDRPARKFGNVLAVLFPGTARQWGAMGGVVLLAWMFLLFQFFMLKMYGSPYILTFIATPNVSRAYWVAGDAMTLINPGWKMLYLAPAVLFAVNLWVVSKGMRTSAEPSATAATV